jgi:hypothetical protein
MAKVTTHLVATKILHGPEIVNGKIVSFNGCLQSLLGRFEVDSRPVGGQVFSIGCDVITSVGASIVRSQCGVETVALDGDGLEVVVLIRENAKEARGKVYARNDGSRLCMH